MKKTHSFSYVAFWDKTAWVAGATAFNQVAQGETLQEAVDNLKMCLQFVAIGYQAAGRRPFEVHGLPETPLDEFTKTKGCMPAVDRPVKGKRYLGSFVVEWDSRIRGFEWEEVK